MDGAMVMTRWQRFKRWLNSRIWGGDGVFHYHTWDTGHYWYDNPRNEPDDGDVGFYYLCTVCGEKKITEYPN